MRRGKGEGERVIMSWLRRTGCRGPDLEVDDLRNALDLDEPEVRGCRQHVNKRFIRQSVVPSETEEEERKKEGINITDQKK